MTQKQRLVPLLRRGWISPREALEQVGCFRLAARIADLKADGFQIESKWVRLSSAPSSKQVKAYRIIAAPAGSQAS